VIAAVLEGYFGSGLIQRDHSSRRVYPADDQTVWADSWLSKTMASMRIGAGMSQGLRSCGEQPACQALPSVVGVNGEPVEVGARSVLIQRSHRRRSSAGEPRAEERLGRGRSVPRGRRDDGWAIGVLGRQAPEVVQHGVDVVDRRGAQDDAWDGLGAEVETGRLSAWPLARVRGSLGVALGSGTVE
jgi:hypothetical protein